MGAVKKWDKRVILLCTHSAPPNTLTRTMPSLLPVTMTWLASHTGPSTMQQHVMVPSGPQAVVILAKGCPLTSHKDKWAPAQETMVPYSNKSRLYSMQDSPAVSPAHSVPQFVYQSTPTHLLPKLQISSTHLDIYSLMALLRCSGN